MQPAIRHNERGFSLIVGLSVLILLTVLGVSVVHGMTSDVDSAGADRGAQSALAIAESGATWAIDYLKANYQLDQGTSAFVAITGNTHGDLSTYAEASSEEKLGYDAEAPPSPNATTWKLLTHNRNQSFGGGRFHVWVGMDPADTSSSTLLVRSLGIDARGAQRLVEIAVKGAAP